MPKKVLFVQHAGVMGGSVKSLKGLLQNLDSNVFSPTLLLIRPTDVVRNYYGNLGIDVFETQEIWPVAHSSGSWASLTRPADVYSALLGIAHWRRTGKTIRRIVKEQRCDIVHLNSSILLPCAYALRNSLVPVVWHVREAPQPKFFGNRLRFFRYAFTHWPSKCLFLSNADRQGWLGQSASGEVVPNSAEGDLFDVGPDKQTLREKYNIREDAVCVLYLGGFAEIKGIYPLLAAAGRLKTEKTQFIFLMPGTSGPVGQGFISKLGRAVLRITSGGTDRMNALRIIERDGLAQMVKLLPFALNMRELLQVSDMLVFPATVPHFAMPVIEAGAASRPVIVSDYPGIRELVEDGRSGLVVPINNSEILAKAIFRLGHSPRLRDALAKRGKELAQTRFTYSNEASLISKVYDSVLPSTQQKPTLSQ